MDQGIIPWKCPWNKTDAAPKNLISNKNYSGINIFLLAMQGYKSQYWASYNQVSKLGGNVKRGEKSSIVTFWKMLEDKKDPKKVIPILRYYRVFNLEQCENVDTKRLKEERESYDNNNTLDFDPIESAELIIENFKDGPEIKQIGQRACYNPMSDIVRMPPKESFNKEQEYYSTLFHELGHSTGHKARLNRDSLEGMAAFGTATYSKEELVAEFCASFLCADAGILNHTVDNSAAYIKGWSKFIKKNPKAIISAAAQGRKAAEHITKQVEKCSQKK